MERSKEEELEIFVKKTIKEAGIEAPSSNFTDSVLANIRRQKPTETVPYKPVISKMNWFLIIASLIVIVVYTLLSDSTVNLPWLASFDPQSLRAAHLFNGISKMKISNTYLYGVVGFTFFVGVQVFLLKNHINKRYLV